MKKKIMEECDKALKTFTANVNKTIIHVRKSHKSIKTVYTRNKHANVLIKELNSLVNIANKNENKISRANKDIINTKWQIALTKLNVTLTRLKLRVPLNGDLWEQANIETLDERGESDPTEDVQTEDNLGSEDTIVLPEVMSFDIKTASTLLSVCDGSPDQVVTFIDALTLLRELTPANHAEILLRFAKVRLTGKAKNVTSAAVTIDELIKELKTHCAATESSAAVEMRLKAVRQTGDAATYATKIEELTQKLASQHIAEGIPAAAATRLATKCGIAALVQGARNPQTRLILKAGSFNTMTDAVTKLLQEDAAPDEVAQILALGNSQGSQRGGGFRGGQRGGYRGNSGRYNGRSGGGRFNSGGRGNGGNGGRNRGHGSGRGYGGQRSGGRNSNIRATNAADDATNQENERGPQQMELGARNRN